MSTVQQSSPFVQIRAGSDMPPIVIAHGLSGVVQFAELARHIQTDRRIYGIRARGIDGREEPLDRVEDMAEFYLDSLAEICPTGPYILIGYSFGGLVAFEMAQKLAARGKNVAHLILLDAYPHPRFLPAPDRLRLFCRRMKNHSQQIWQLPRPAALAYILSGFKRRLHFPGALHESQRPPETLGLSLAETALRRVNQKAYLAYSRYQPSFYPGKLQFVTTEIKSFFPGNPAHVWGKLVSEFVVEVIPGDHLNIVTTEFMPLAGVLSRYLNEIAPPPCAAASTR